MSDPASCSLLLPSRNAIAVDEDHGPADHQRGVELELGLFALDRLEDVASLGVLGAGFALGGVDDDLILGLGNLDRSLALGAGAGLAAVLVADLEAGVAGGANDMDGHGVSSGRVVCRLVGERFLATDVSGA